MGSVIYQDRWSGSRSMFTEKLMVNESTSGCHSHHIAVRTASGIHGAPDTRINDLCMMEMTAWGLLGFCQVDVALFEY